MPLYKEILILLMFIDLIFLICWDKKYWKYNVHWANQCSCRLCLMKSLSQVGSLMILLGCDRCCHRFSKNPNLFIWLIADIVNQDVNLHNNLVVKYLHWLWHFGLQFPDVVDFAEEMASLGKTVIIAALDGTFQRQVSIWIII